MLKIKILFIALLVLILTIGGFIYFRNSQDNRSQGTNDISRPEALVNLNPPTEQERQSGDAAKPKILQQEQARSNGSQATSSGKKSVTPTITYADQYGQQIEVGGFVSGIFEDGGTCTLELQKEGRKVSVKVNSIKGANSVDCPVMSISRTSLEAGQWQASITYSSTNAVGQSQARAIEVK